MAKNTLPPIVLQTIEALTDKSTPEHIKFNYLRSLNQYRDWETDRKSTRLNSSHRL